MTELVTTERIRVIHALLAKIGRANDKDYKLELVQTYSNGRETSTTKLYMNEAGRMIIDLKKLTGSTSAAGKMAAKPRMTEEQEQADRKRKKLISIAHSMHWTIDGKADVDRISGWCEKHGQYHKPLMEHTVVELSHIIVQFDKVYKSFLKSI
jgi:hypothetical protein